MSSLSVGVCGPSQHSFSTGLVADGGVCDPTEQLPQLGEVDKISNAAWSVKTSPLLIKWEI